MRSFFQKIKPSDALKKKLFFKYNRASLEKIKELYSKEFSDDFKSSEFNIFYYIIFNIKDLDVAISIIKGNLNIVNSDIYQRNYNLYKKIKITGNWLTDSDDEARYKLHWIHDLNAVEFSQISTVFDFTIIPVNNENIF